MALNKAKLKTDILTILTTMRTKTEVSDDEYATKLSDAIDAFVKTGTVNAGITVSTSGTAAAQTGATTGTGIIS